MLTSYDLVAAKLLVQLRLIDASVVRDALVYLDERPELGFMEYRLPVYAQVFDVPIRTPWEPPSSSSPRSV